MRLERKEKSKKAITKEILKMLRTKLTVNYSDEPLNFARFDPHNNKMESLGVSVSNMNTP